MAKVINNTYAVTNKALLSYAHINEPHEPMNGGEPVYSSCVIIPKDDTETIDAIKTAINNAYNGYNWRGRKPAATSLRMPLRDGDVDRPDDPTCKNCYFLNAKSKQKPQVVDLHKAAVDPSGIYSGMYANVVLSFYCYDTSGNKGIGCGLGSIQKVEDGPRLGGGMPDINTAFGGAAADDGLPF